MLGLGMEAAAVSRAQRLSGLKRIIPDSLIKKILTECQPRSRACTRLPASLVLWFVLAMGLFCRDCYRQVFRWLVPFKPGGAPGRSTLCEARRRLGVRPLVLLAREVIGLLASQKTPGAFYRGHRLMALDGFVVDVPDTPANARVFGRFCGSRGKAAFPQLRVLALCEAGTHVIWRWASKPFRFSEQSMCPVVLRELEAGMLLLWDRSFLSFDRLELVKKRGAQLLARIQKGFIFKPLKRLSDGSYLSRAYPSSRDRQRDKDGVMVRIIEYTFDDRERPGHGQKHRMLTTLLDASLDPAPTLIGLYHDRWEEELTIDEVKTHQLERPVLRSQTPAGVVQELYAVLLDHYVVRVLMHEVAGQEHVPPRRISFTGTLKILRCRVPECPVRPEGQRRWLENLMLEIGEEILPPRRDRINPRVIKRSTIKWRKKRPQHLHPPRPKKSFADAIVMLR
jgi:hypothetical protein